MNLEHKDPKDESCLILTDFTCADGRKYLKEHKTYKITWAKDDLENITIDGCVYNFKKNELMFCTPSSIVEIPEKHNKLRSIVFNQEFYCTRENDEEVSCNGLLFYGSPSFSSIIINGDNLEVFEDIYSIIEDELMEKNRSYSEMLRSMLKRLLICSTRKMVADFKGNVKADNKIEVIRSFYLEVEKNYKKHHKLIDYANIIGKSPKTISNLFSIHSYTTPLQIINTRIVVEAK